MKKVFSDRNWVLQGKEKGVEKHRRKPTYEITVTDVTVKTSERQVEIGDRVIYRRDS